MCEKKKKAYKQIGAKEWRALFIFSPSLKKYR